MTEPKLDSYGRFEVEQFGDKHYLRLGAKLVTVKTRKEYIVTGVQAEVNGELGGCTLTECSDPDFSELCETSAELATHFEFPLPEGWVRCHDEATDLPKGVTLTMLTSGGRMLRGTADLTSQGFAKSYGLSIVAYQDPTK